MHSIRCVFLAHQSHWSAMLLTCVAQPPANFATTSHTARMLQEVRAFIALNDSQLVASRMNDTDPQEVWGYYPDDWPLKGLHAGDSRAALTPFLAHEVQLCLAPFPCPLGTLVFSVVLSVGYPACRIEHVGFFFQVSRT